MGARGSFYGWQATQPLSIISEWRVRWISRHRASAKRRAMYGRQMREAEVLPEHEGPLG